MIKFNLKLFVVPLPVSIVGQEFLFLKLCQFPGKHLFTYSTFIYFFLAKFYLFSHCYRNSFTPLAMI